MVDPTADVALLTPVPQQHLESGLQRCAETGLARQLVEAERQLEAAQKLPRRSAAGRAEVKVSEDMA